MTNYTMNLKELRDFAWDVARNKKKGLTMLGICVVIFLGVVLLSALFGVIMGYGLHFYGVGELDGDSVLGSGSMILQGIFQMVIVFWSVHIYLDWARGVDSGFRAFWRKIAWGKILTLFLSGLVVEFFGVLGLLLLIIPGIFILVRFAFVSYVALDKDLSIRETVKYGWNITEGHFWDLVLFGLYFLLFNILGALCLGIGIIWTSTMTNIAFAKLYDQFVEEYENKKR